MIQVNYALPYRVAPAAAVSAGPWRYRTADGELAELPASHPAWDCSVDVAPRRTVRVSRHEVTDACGLERGTALRMVAIAYSPGSGIRRTVWSRAILASEQETEMEVDFHLSGPQLAGSLLLSCELVLAEAQTSGNRLAPRLPGSRLWADEYRVQLEGGASRFPVEAVDFATTAGFPDGRAAWHLIWDPDDLETPYLQGVRLFLNTAHPAVQRALAGSDPAVWSSVYHDIGRRLVSGFLRREKLPESPDYYSEGSVGRHVFELARSCFPGDSVTSMQRLLEQQPDVLETRLQGALGYLHD